MPGTKPRHTRTRLAYEDYIYVPPAATTVPKATADWRAQLAHRLGDLPTVPDEPGYGAGV